MERLQTSSVPRQARGRSDSSFVVLRDVTTSFILSIDLILRGLEGSSEVGLELGMTSSTRRLFLAARLGALSLDGSLASSRAGISSLLLGLTHSLVGRVEALHQRAVLKWVLLGL